MEDVTINQKHQLKYNEDFCTCDVCGTDVDSFDEGKGSFVLCPEHNSWIGWFKAWRLCS